TSLQCEVCHSIGKSCSGPMKTCSGGEDTCGIILHEVMIGSPWVSCSFSFSLTEDPEIRMVWDGKSSLFLCISSSSFLLGGLVPPEDNVPNGYQCPACYSVDSFQCGNEIVNCTGSETQCVDLAGLMNSGNCLLFGAV
ncbi:PINLY protein, partial [Hydrobates tethys]|nr:PINLY protein [Oceanodroma tethys]